MFNYNAFLVMDLIPIVGDEKGLIECLVGQDLITGRELSALERVLCAISLISLIDDGASILKAGVKEGIGSATKIFAKEAGVNVIGYMGSAAMQEAGINPLVGLAFYQCGRVGWKNKDKIIDALKNNDILNSTKGASEADILKNAGLDKVKIDEILSIPKGSRPDPSTYISKDYIEQHLKQFENGGSFVMTRDQYEWHVEGNSFIGFNDNTQFVAPKDFMDKIEKVANGDISVYEKMLGFDDGYFQSGGGLVRFDAINLKDLEIRIPSGNEAGANSHWILGGLTDGGTPEAIINKIPNNDEYIKISFIN